MPTIAENVGAGFGVLMEHAGKTGAQWAGPPFILYPGGLQRRVRDRHLHAGGLRRTGGEGVDVEEIPGGLVATTTHVGPYREVGKAYTALQKWMTDNGRRPAGMAREIYLNDPGEVPAERTADRGGLADRLSGVRPSAST